MMIIAGEYVELLYVGITPQTPSAIPNSGPTFWREVFQICHSSPSVTLHVFPTFGGKGLEPWIRSFTVPST